MKIYLDPDSTWGWIIYDEDTERILVAMNCIGFKTSEEAEQQYNKACGLIDNSVEFEDCNGLHGLLIPDCCGQTAVYLTKDAALDDFEAVRDFMRSNENAIQSDT